MFLSLDLENYIAKDLIDDVQMLPPESRGDVGLGILKRYFKALSGDIQNSYARTKHTFFIQIMHKFSQAVLETSFWQFEVLTAFMNGSGSFIVFVRNYEKFEVVLQFFYKSNGVIFKTLLVFYSRACFF